MMDGTQCFSDVAATRSVMPSYQGQAGLLPVASRRNNDRECPRTAGTAPNMIPYVLPSASSFSSRPSRQGEPLPLPSSIRLVPLPPTTTPFAASFRAAFSLTIFRPSPFRPCVSLSPSLAFSSPVFASPVYSRFPGYLTSFSLFRGFLTDPVALSMQPGGFAPLRPVPIATNSESRKHR